MSPIGDALGLILITPVGDVVEDVAKDALGIALGLAPGDMVGIALGANVRVAMGAGDVVDAVLTLLDASANGEVPTAKAQAQVNIA